MVGSFLGVDGGGPSGETSDPVEEAMSVGDGTMMVFYNGYVYMRGGEGVDEVV